MAKKLITTLNELQRTKEQYESSKFSKNVTVLLTGEMGEGKTHFARTCPGPVFMHTLDSRGEQTVKYGKNSIEDGHIFCDNQFQFGANKYQRWTKEMDRLSSSSFFNDIGTYMLDSFTVLNECLFQAVDRNWLEWSSNLKSLIDDLTRLPCHVVLTGHLELVKDELSGATQYYIYTPGKAKFWMGIYFSEVYVLTSKVKAPIKSKDDEETTENGTIVDGMLYQVVTRNYNRYKARTRIGANGLFSAKEKPDFKYLLKKSGFPYEDKVVA